MQQQTNTQGGTAWYMNQPTSGQSIDNKDLSVVQDQMYSEALAYKKCSVYSSWFTDPSLKNLASIAAQHHKQHFDALQSYLESKQ